MWLNVGESKACSHKLAAFSDKMFSVLAAICSALVVQSTDVFKLHIRARILQDFQGAAYKRVHGHEQWRGVVDSAVNR